VIKLKRPKIIILLIVVAAVIGTAIYINLNVYDFYSPLIKWSKTNLLKTETAPAKLEQTTQEKTEAAGSGKSDANQIKAASDVNQIPRFPDFRGRPNFDPNRMQEFASRRGFDPNNMPRGFGRGGFDPNNMPRGFGPGGFDPNQMPRDFGGFRQGRGRNRQMPFGGADSNQPGEPNRPGEPNQPSDPNKIMEFINLKDVQMRDVITKLAEWTGKVIIPTDEAMNQKITIYSAKRMPRPQALSLLYAALRTKGFVAEETDGVIYLKPIKEAMFGSVPIIPADKPLATIENKSQVVQKYFKLTNYSPTNMSSIILPMIGEYGYVSADENTGSLLIIDTVQNLMAYEKIINQFDTPGAGKTITKVFTIQQGDPSEIVQLIKLLLGTSDTTGTSPSSRRPLFRPQGPASQPGSGTKPAASVTITTVESQVVLIPEPKRKWIIAKSSPEQMKQIEEWINQLDRKEEFKSEYETVSVKYVDAAEVGDRINTALQKMPGTELKSSVLVQPLSQARQIMIFGTAQRREMVKKLIAEIDIPTGKYETKAFKLQYADPDQIKANIDSLYGTSQSSMYDYYGSRYSSSTSEDNMVKAISFPAMQQVTVIASPENILKITTQIKEWDVPLNVEALKPRIIELRNTDPVQMATLLSKLFSESSSSGQSSLLELYLGYRSGQSSSQQKKIVGALYGQLSFEAVPDTKKIIIISKVPEAYKVVEELIKELDKEEMAEVPEVVTLKYANPEDLAIRLNAIFNEQGVPAPIWFSATGLSQYSMNQSTSTSGSSSSTSSTTSTGTSSGQQQGANTGTQYTPPWSSQRSSTTTDKMPISNVIGRIRFIPEPHSKSLLVLSPPEFKDRIIKMIEQLDQPGKQVMIKAIIMEVDHSNLTSLGLQLTNTSNVTQAFGALKENAVTAITKLSMLQTYGALTLDASADITTLVDFLIKNTNAKILNQQTLWTKDNEEAEFFKGDNVAFLTGTSTTGTGGVASQNYEFNKVGMTLRTRPSITPEKNVDMIINVILSELTSDVVNGQPVRSEMDTQTNMIVQDSQTLMLGGILFQKDSKIERKIPLIGDLPGIGPFLRHYDTVKSNNELIVFITPYVIDTEKSPEAEKMLKEAEQKLENMLKQQVEKKEKKK
jgi:type II secretory pathway component GspD/PulD (secretin)